MDRAALRDHLLRTAIAGTVVTTREVNRRSYRDLAARRPHQLFGLTLARTWTEADVLALMAAKVGVHPDGAYEVGADTIDPDRCLDALDAMADRLRTAVERAESVLLATSHVAALILVYVELARALAARGCRVLTPPLHDPVVFDDPEPHLRAGPHFVRYLGGVATLTTPESSLVDTHSPLPMQAILRASGDQLPDLVIADHGFAGAAGEAGIDTVGFADCNDPALFVGEAEGKVRVAVPLDDDVDSVHYKPLTAYLLHRAGL